MDSFDEFSRVESSTCCFSGHYMNPTLWNLKVGADNLEAVQCSDHLSDDVRGNRHLMSRLWIELGIVE
jgi:hypothetical protein